MISQHLHGCHSHLSHHCLSLGLFWRVSEMSLYLLPACGTICKIPTFPASPPVTPSSIPVTVASSVFLRLTNKLLYKRLCSLCFLCLGGFPYKTKWLAASGWLSRNLSTIASSSLELLARFHLWPSCIKNNNLSVFLFLVSSFITIYLIFFFLKFYLLFTREREREWEWGRGRRENIQADSY